MTTNLNANAAIGFAPTPQKASAKPTVRNTVQVNHAAVAACLCALILIGILMLPTLYSSASTTEIEQPLVPNQEYWVQGY